MVEGIWFQSKKEGERWAVLVSLLRAGRISCLTRQRRFKLKVNGHLVCTYVADFVYIEAGRQVVEDVKSPVSRKLQPYPIKKKMMMAIYGIEIKET